jgi:hypothetical protein
MRATYAPWPSENLRGKDARCILSDDGTFEEISAKSFPQGKLTEPFHTIRPGGGLPKSQELLKQDEAHDV